MTEAEWAACDDPARMLAVVSGGVGTLKGWRASDRKLRLFACACRRQVPYLQWDGPSQGWADMEDNPERETLANGIGPGVVTALEHAELFVGQRILVAHKPRPEVAAAILRDIVGDPFRRPRPVYNPLTEVGRVACRPDEWVFHLDWVTPTARSLAQAAYEERNADGTLDAARLAVLSDAMEEAGCPAEEDAEADCETCDGMGRVDAPAGDIARRWPCDDCNGGTITVRRHHPLLAHLRTPGPHYRGCWALDLILGRG